MDGRKARGGKACTLLSMASDTLPHFVSAHVVFRLLSPCGMG